jgi:hypothetical protein
VSLVVSVFFLFPIGSFGFSFVFKNKIKKEKLSAKD